MRFSRKTDYGIILVGALKPSFKSGRFIALSGLARENRLPLAFLQKLAELLRRAGLVSAKRGKVGGYRLIREPKTITLKELIALFEEPKMMRCMKSSNPKKYCALAGTCPTRKTWYEVEKDVDKIFEKVTMDAM